MSRLLRGRSLAIVVAVATVILGATTSTGVMQRGSTASAASSAPVTLRVWDQFSGTQNKIVSSIYASFTALHPNIKIRREAINTTQMRQTVKTSLSSGTGPDIIYYDAGPGYAGVLAQAGLLHPLDAYAAQYGWTKRILPSALQGTKIRGQIYGLPLEVDLIGVYYNQTLLDKAGLAAPQTFDQLLSFCHQAKAKGYIPLAFSDNPGWQAFHQFSMMVNNLAGPEAIRNLLYNNQGSWNTPEMVRAIKLYFVDMQKAGCFSRTVNALGYDDANSLFYKGKALLNPTGSWLVSDIDTHIGSRYTIKMMPFPAISGGKARAWVSGVGSAYFISAKSAHPQEAAMFLDYLFSAQATKRWAEEANLVLPVKVDTRTVTGMPVYKFVLDVLQSGLSGKTVFGYNIDVLAPAKFNTEMQNGFQAILAGQKDPTREASDLQAAWTQRLK